MPCFSLPFALPCQLALPVYALFHVEQGLGEIGQVRAGLEMVVSSWQDGVRCTECHESCNADNDGRTCVFEIRLRP